MDDSNDYCGMEMIFANANTVSPEVLKLIGGMAAAAVSYMIGRRNYVKENLQAVTIKLWERREKQYRILMGYMGIIPLYPSLENETNLKKLNHLSVVFRGWYFDYGGLLLTTSSRIAFMEFQKAVKKYALQVEGTHLHGELLKNVHILEGDDEMSISVYENQKTNGYEYFQKKLSALRTELTNDLTSRNRGLL